MADSFHAFIQNLTVAVTGTTCGAAVISLPRSQVEMTEWDMQWQERISKVVRRLAKDLIANDETEIGEVVRRRLFEDLGNDRIRKNVAKSYADWCFERRAQLPPEWTAVDTATTEAKAKDFLRARVESCYPFHPATLSVFQRKWQALSQYQQTRGTLAMLAQWISWGFRDGYQRARREPLITLGSAPLDVMEFRSTVLGQLGESRLIAAIDADIAGEQSHARALDADTRGELRDVHRRVATAILFESSGGQIDKAAHLPELRFALGEPGMDTTSIDNAAMTLETKAYFVRKVGSDGFRIHHKPRLKKVVNDRKASLDEKEEVLPAMRKLVDQEFRKGATIPVLTWEDPEGIADSPKLTLVVLDADMEWSGQKTFRRQLAEWTKKKGKSDRSYPGALVWCLKKPGRDLRDKVEIMLAWRRVGKEVRDGTLGAEFEHSDLTDVQAEVKTAEEAATDEVWGGYRFAALADSEEPEGIRVIDLGAGHSSGPETLCGRVIAAMKSNALLNEGVGAGYLERNWPPALKGSGAWPLKGLRQSFLNGTLTRLLDPDAVLRSKIVDFVSRGDFGLASGQRPDGTFDRVWFKELVPADEVTFEPGVFLLTKAKAKKPAAETKTDKKVVEEEQQEEQEKSDEQEEEAKTEKDEEKETAPTARTLRVAGSVPSESWNRLGTKLIPKLKQGKDLRLDIVLSATFETEAARNVETELRQSVQDLGLQGQVRVEEGPY
jgi:hypothetical protein